MMSTDGGLHQPLSTSSTLVENLVQTSSSDSIDPLAMPDLRATEEAAAERANTSDVHSKKERSRLRSSSCESEVEMTAPPAKRLALACCICHKVIHRDTSSKPMVRQTSGVFAIVEDDEQRDCIFTVDVNLFDKSPYACNRCAARNKEQSKVMCAICGLERPFSAVKHDVSMKDGVVFIGHRECAIPTVNSLLGHSSRACGGCYTQNMRCLEKAQSSRQNVMDNEAAALAADNEALRKQVAELKERLEKDKVTAAAKSAELEQEVPELKQRIKTLSEETSWLRKHSLEVEQVAAKEGTELMTIVQQLFAMVDEKQQVINRHANRIESIEPSVRAIVNRHSMQIRDIRLTIEDRHYSRAGIDQARVSPDSTSASLISESSEAQASSVTAEGSQLHGEVERLTQALGEATAKATSLQELNAEMRRELHGKDDECRHYLNQVVEKVVEKDQLIDKHVQRIKEMESELLAVRRSLSQRSDINTANEAKLKRVTSDLNHAKTANGVLEQRNAAQEADLKKQSNTISQLTQSLAKATKDMQAASARLAALRSEYDQLAKQQSSTTSKPVYIPSAPAVAAAASSAQHVNAPVAPNQPTTDSLFRICDNGTIMQLKVSAPQTVLVITSSMSVEQLYVHRTRAVTWPYAYLQQKSAASSTAEERETFVPLFFEFNMAKLREVDVNVSCKTVPVSLIEW